MNDDAFRSYERFDGAFDQILPCLHQHLHGDGAVDAAERDRHRERLPGPKALELAAAALAGVVVELGERVVEQEQRRHSPSGRDELRLGEKKREHGEPLLALGAEGAEVTIDVRGSALPGRVVPLPFVAKH